MKTEQATKTSNITYAQSMVLMKNMVRISISSICYMRELFPEYCFKRKAYGSAEIHQLQGAQEESDGEISVTNENAFLLTQWLEQGVFEALQEQYLNTMTFSIYCAHPITGKDLLIENYEFKVSYAEGEEPARINNVELTSKDAVKNQAIKFIRSLTQFTQTLDKLPADRWITLSLTYLDSTPVDYEPKYFKPSDDGCNTSMKHLNLLINIGSLKTSTVEMKVKFAGLESLLFEDLCKVGIVASSSSTAGTKPALFNGVSYSTSGSHDDELVDDLGKLDVTNPSPFTTQNSPNDVTSLVSTVKKYILSNNAVGVTPKNCARKLRLAEKDVKKAFVTLVDDGVIKRQGKGYQAKDRAVGKTITAVAVAAASSSHSKQQLCSTRSPDDCISVSYAPEAPIKQLLVKISEQETQLNDADDIEDTCPTHSHSSRPSTIPPTSRAGSKQQLALQLEKSVGKQVARRDCDPLQKQAHHNLKRDLQHQEISSSQVSEASESLSKRHKKVSVIKDPIYFK